MTDKTMCADCGAECVPSDCTTGYAVIVADGRKVCFVCADAIDRAEMASASEHVVYLSGDGSRLTTWTGGELARVTIRRKTLAGFGRGQTYIRATDARGAEWYGRGAGEGMAMRVRRAKSA